MLLLPVLSESPLCPLFVVKSFFDSSDGMYADLGCSQFFLPSPSGLANWILHNHPNTMIALRSCLYELICMWCPKNVSLTYANSKIHERECDVMAEGPEALFRFCGRYSSLPISGRSDISVLVTASN
jgi:hypothetical protein